MIAHVFSGRTKKTLRKLIRLISGYKFKFYCTDNWKPYEVELSVQNHAISKKLAQSIHRTNLTLRIRLKRSARKTICFSRSEELHDRSSVSSSQECGINRFETRLLIYTSISLEYCNSALLLITLRIICQFFYISKLVPT